MNTVGVLVGKLDHHRNATFSAQQVALFAHFVIGYGIGGDRGPDRDDGLDPHLVEVPDKAFGVGPVGRVELPFALPRPGEEIDDDAGQRQVAAPVFAGDRKDLVLRAVSQLALPQTRGPVGQDRRVPCCGDIGRQDLGRAVAGGDPVVHPRRRIGQPAGHVGSEIGAPRRGVVPQEAVAPRRQDKGHHDMGVLLDERGGRALEILEPVLRLAQPHQLFTLIGPEPRLELERPACDGFAISGEGPAKWLRVSDRSSCPVSLRTKLISGSFGTSAPSLRASLTSARRRPFVICAWAPSISISGVLSGGSRSADTCGSVTCPPGRALTRSASGPHGSIRIVSPLKRITSAAPSRE